MRPPLYHFHETFALASAVPGALSRVYVDTGPVFEREWAAEARIGWFGRNTNLLNRYHGSYFFRHPDAWRWSRLRWKH